MWQCQQHVELDRCPHINSLETHILSWSIALSTVCEHPTIALHIEGTNTSLRGVHLQKTLCTDIIKQEMSDLTGTFNTPIYYTWTKLLDWTVIVSFQHFHKHKCTWMNPNYHYNITI